MFAWRGRCSVGAWATLVGTVLILVLEPIMMLVDTNIETFSLYILGPLFLYYPVIFVVGTVFSYWFGRGIRSAAFTFAVYFVAFVLIWEVVTLWGGPTWEDFLNGMGTTGMFGIAYLILAYLGVLVCVAIRRVRRRW